MNKNMLLYTNDFHSHIPESLSTLNQMFTLKKESLIVDTGDFSEGHAFYTLFGGEPEKMLISKIYDVIAPGNHGFQNLIELNQKKFPIINCHLLYNGSLLFKPDWVSQLGKYKLGFVGLMSKESFLSIEVKYRKYLEYIDPKESLPKIVQLLKQKTDFIILLSHSGFENDKVLAKKYDGVDVIISGHCHSENTEIVLNDTLIVKAPELGTGFGKLTFSDTLIKHNIIRNQRIKINENRIDFLNPYLIQYDSTNSNELFFVSLSFSSNYCTRKKLMDYLVEQICLENDSDLCIINFHCLRGVLPHGGVTLTMLMNYMPFNTTLVKCSINRDLLNDYLGILPKDIKDYLCISPNSNTQSEFLCIITTEYLMSNYFKPICSSKEKEITSLIDYVINHFSQDGNL